MEERDEPGDSGLSHEEDFVGLRASGMREAILAVEAALTGGTNLEAVLGQPGISELIGPILAERYRKLASYQVEHDAVFRANWIEKIIGDFRFWLRKPESVFAARSASPGWQWQPSVAEYPPVPPLSVSSRYGPVVLRADQVLSARRWGIWFEFDDDVLERTYKERLVAVARHELSSQIYSLSHIEATYLSGTSKLMPTPDWGVAHRGDFFEHLILDVLNEETLAARRADLAEDILERTDLRLKVRGVERRRGARLQVSLTVRAEHQDRKIDKMRFAQELIILTPLTLADAAINPPASPPFEHFPWENLWLCFGAKAVSREQFAQQLHELFVASFTLATNHPLGPAFVLPPPVRRFVRMFAETAAVDTTSSMRGREHRLGRWRGSSRKFDDEYRKNRLREKE